MRLETDAIGLATLILVLLAYLLFGSIFLFRKKPPQTEEAKRAPAATLGIALQSISFALVWSLPRSRWWPFRSSLRGEWALGMVAVLLAYGSCWFCLRAVQALGKQWTYRARVIKGHELITQGPYAAVRNPIYLGMFGLILAAGLAFSRWWTGLAAVLLFLIGNRIRIRVEEQLLREAFGTQFDNYARRVPAFVPRPWRRDRRSLGE
jgi:protein-S-isoprenylcysteine O-methyltransferase Ste14